MSTDSLLPLRPPSPCSKRNARAACSCAWMNICGCCMPPQAITGIAVEELTRLLLTDVDLDGHTLLIHSKGNTHRKVSLEKKATQALRAYLADRLQSVDQHLFLNYQGTGLSVRGVMDIVQKYCNLAGISKKCSCHSLRQTCARYKAAKGFTPRQTQALLGHEQVETSLIHIHPATTDARKLMEQTNLSNRPVKPLTSVTGI